MRLLCLVAFALCFSGLAHAQNSILTIAAPDPVVEGTGAGNVQTFRLLLDRPASQNLTVTVRTFEIGGTQGALNGDRFPFTRDIQPLGFFNGFDNGIDVGHSCRKAAGKL